jgi:hypothetical protein
LPYSFDRAQSALHNIGMRKTAFFGRPQKQDKNKIHTQKNKQRKEEDKWKMIRK